MTFRKPVCWQLFKIKKLQFLPNFATFWSFWQFFISIFKNIGIYSKNFENHSNFQHVLNFENVSRTSFEEGHFWPKICKFSQKSQSLSRMVQRLPKWIFCAWQWIRTRQITLSILWSQNWTHTRYNLLFVWLLNILFFVSSL